MVADASLYGILGVKPQATSEELRKAHRKLVLLWHPDKVPDCGDEIAVKVATQQFQLIQAAYEALSDPIARRKYDLESSVGSARGPDDEVPPWKRSRFSQTPPTAPPKPPLKTELRVPGDASTVAVAVDLLPANGGTVFVDPGFHDGLVVVSKPFVRIVASSGDLVGRPVLRGQIVFRQCAAGAVLRGLVVSASCPGGAVDLKGVVGDVTVEECEIRNKRSAGITFEGCSGTSTITRCVVQGCEHDGLGLHLLNGESSHLGSLTITDSKFLSNRLDGLYLGDFRFAVRAVRCEVRENARYGICVRDTNFDMRECVVERNGEDAVHFETSVRVAPPEDAGGRGAVRGVPTRVKKEPARGQRAREIQSPELPEGWRLFRTSEGSTYYFHGLSGRVQWEPPTRTSGCKPQPEVSPGCPTEPLKI